LQQHIHIGKKHIALPITSRSAYMTYINKCRSSDIMPLFDTNDGLTTHQEGSSTRVKSGNLNFLFRDSTPETIIKTYTHYVAAAREIFGRRWRSFKGPNMNEDDFLYLTQKATLCSMYFYIVNRMPVNITEADWNHPAAREIVQEVVERRFSRGTKEATSLCAHLMALSEKEYLGWQKGHELFINR
jgi:hypothetical protein